MVIDQKYKLGLSINIVALGPNFDKLFRPQYLIADV
jgi:hypothetical protein